MKKVELRDCLAARCLFRGQSVLSGPEIDELVEIVPHNYLSLCERHDIASIRRASMDFEQRFDSMEQAVIALSAGIIDNFGGDDWIEIELAFRHLLVLHPAVWYRVYKQVKQSSLVIGELLRPRRVKRRTR